MFVSFNRVFGEGTTSYSNSTTDLLRAYFDSIAPDGTHYHIESDGTFLLEPIEGNTVANIRGLQVENEAKLKSIIGDQLNFNNIIKYAYNSQTEILLKPSDDDKILINGTPLPINLFAFNPKRKKNFNKKNSRFVLKPEPFPAPFKLELSNDKHKLTVLMHRISNESLDIKVFETTPDEPLGLVFKINETTGVTNLTFKTNLTSEKRVENYVKVYSLCASFLDDTILFDGKSLGTLNFNETNSVFSVENLEFWEKVLKVEKILNTTFEPANVPLTIEIINTVEELYQTLINKKPIRCSVRIDSFESSEVPSEAQKYKNALSFIFSHNSSYSLFKANLTLPSIWGVYNCKISKIERVNSVNRIHLVDISSELSMKVCKFNYPDELSRDSIDIRDAKIINQLKDAISPREYFENNQTR